MGDVLMRNDSGVKSATGLTGSGTRDWVIQRISAAILALYSIVMMGFFLSHALTSDPITYGEWVRFIMSMPMRLFSFLAIVALAGHAWVGMWTIFTDYVKSSGLRFILQALMIIAILVYLFWGIMIFWGPGIIA